MALLNYTTKVDSTTTANQIITILSKHGTKKIMMEYDKDGFISGLSFMISTVNGDIPFKLPVELAAIKRVLETQWQRGQISRSYTTEEHARRVAWRILKDWVEAQMAIIETQMVKLEQVFLPYMINPQGKTLYEVVLESKFLLKAKDGD